MFYYMKTSNLRPDELSRTAFTSKLQRKPNYISARCEKTSGKFDFARVVPYKVRAYQT